jgi:hypothetical protein
MGIFAGPGVIEDGLVLALDAANLKGYDKYENLTLQTSQIGVTPTYSVAGIVTLNTTATTAPNGLNEASLLDNDGNANQYVFGGAAVSLTANTTYTYSIHIKQATKPDFQVTIDENGFGGKRYYITFTYSTETATTGITGAVNDGVVIGSSVTKLTNGWYRLSLTFRTSTTSVGGFVDMINRFGNTPGSNYVWGRQLEIGDTTTDYYATTSSAKTRGTTWTDLSIGGGNNATLVNGPTYNSSNRGSIVFDGVDDYVNISNASALNPSYVSVSCWVRFNNNNTQRQLIAKRNTFAEGSYWLYVSESNVIMWDTYQNSIQNRQSYTFNFLPNVWYNVSATYGSSQKIIYVNGNAVSSTGGGNQLTSVSNDIRIGADTSSLTYFLNGRISQVSIYNRALTATEIQKNFNAQRGRFGI